MLAAGLAGWCLHPGTSPASAAPDTAVSAQRFGVTAWLPYWEMPKALLTTVANAGAITTASPYWYDIAGDSRVRAEAGAGSATAIAQLTAHRERILPMVTEQAGMREFASILADPARRDALVRTLVALASHPGYAGLDIDFESFAYDPKHRSAPAAWLASAYPRLIAQTCRALHAIRRVCEVAVMARTSDARGYDHGDIPSWIYDYRALAAVADRVQIMAYDDHSPGGPAGPIAPLPWVRRVIAYARSTAPAGRFELGIPAYGYDWSGRTSASAVYAGQLSALAASVHARPRWDPVQGEVTFRYRVGRVAHTVWVVTAAADAARARLALAAGFAGVAVWAAGYGEPQLWAELRRATPPAR